ncbi:MAG: DUF4373 domain-containing protein [Prevotella sp.]|nr:DUF4373 domain-containing protein [Prevotella sp.]
MNGIRYSVWFPHYAGTRNDRKVQALRKRFGNGGYAVLIMLLECIAESDDLTLAFDNVEKEVIAGDLGIDIEELDAFVEMCTRFGMITLTDGKLTCAAISERLKPLRDKHNRKVEAGKRGAASRWNKNARTDSTAPDSGVESSSGAANGSGTETNTAPDPSFPYAIVVNVWNDICGGTLETVDPDSIPDGLKTDICRRFTEHKRTDPDRVKEGAEVVSKTVMESKFLTGKGKSRWRTNLAWVMNAEHFERLLAGMYNNGYKFPCEDVIRVWNGFCDTPRPDGRNFSCRKVSTENIPKDLRRDIKARFTERNILYPSQIINVIRWQCQKIFASSIITKQQTTLAWLMSSRQVWDDIKAGKYDNTNTDGTNSPEH